MLLGQLFSEMYCLNTFSHIWKRKIFFCSPFILICKNKRQLFGNLGKVFENYLLFPSKHSSSRWKHENGFIYISLGLLLPRSCEGVRDKCWKDNLDNPDLVHGDVYLEHRLPPLLHLDVPDPARLRRLVPPGIQGGNIRHRTIRNSK